MNVPRTEGSSLHTDERTTRHRSRGRPRKRCRAPPVPATRPAIALAGEVRETSSARCPHLADRGSDGCDDLRASSGLVPLEEDEKLACACVDVAGTERNHDVTRL